MITAEELRRFLIYEPSTGVFIWRVKRGKVNAGNMAGSLEEHGYRRIYVAGRNYMAHILAWLYMTGEFPSAEIDHRNREKYDNRWENLRLSSRSANMQNMARARRDSTVGLQGVSPRGDKFIARIERDNERIYLGYFATAEAAHAAYIKAKAKLHPGAT